MTIIVQGKLTEAESTFSSMKESGCFPDVLTYTAMIQAYSDDGKTLLGCNNI
jgi:pentatricopeptide repeat protein